MSKMPLRAAAAAALTFVALATAAAAIATPSRSARASSATPFLASLHNITTIGSTVSSIGDVNPYGLAIVPANAGAEKAGNYLISNFNAKSNNQGTGSTIVQMTPAGKLSVFATISATSLPGACPGGVGLTTALGILPGGYVVVGSLPTTNGMSATAQFGCLIVLNSSGHPVETIAGTNIEGPWDMATVTHGSTSTLFVSNVLNGGAEKGIHTINNSTVVRITLSTGSGMPKVKNETVVANKIPWRDDKTALAIGPTGVAVASNGTLYVADTLESRIIKIPNAMTRTTALADKGITVSSGGHLNQPLGLELAPNGDIITTNAGDGNFVETTTAGKQVAVTAGDAKAGAGSLFGLTVSADGRSLVYVDDAANSLRTLH